MSFRRKGKNEKNKESIPQRTMRNYEMKTLD